jgi:formate dehydrogenase maturation protein FdhE
MRLSMRSRARLRICPVCGSDAVSSMYADARDGADVRVLVRCGGCATWRSKSLHWVRAHTTLARINRTQRRQLHEIERDLCELSAADTASYRPRRGSTTAIAG